MDPKWELEEEDATFEVLVSVRLEFFDEFDLTCSLRRRRSALRSQRVKMFFAQCKLIKLGSPQAAQLNIFQVNQKLQPPQGT